MALPEQEVLISKSNLYADLRKKKAKSVYFNLKKNASYRSDQSEIWDDINEKTAKFSVDSETHAMSDIYDSHEDKIEDYEKQFKITPDLIGFIAFIGQKIVGLDIFGSTSVLPKVYKKLLRDYILDALDQIEQPASGNLYPGRKMNQEPKNS